MRVAFLMVGSLALTLVGCSKREPEAAPTPTQGGPTTPAVPTTTPPPPPPPSGPSCTEVVTAMANDVAVMIHFDTDQYDIRTGDAAILDTKAEILRSHPQVRIRITGHADERYTDEYNLVLGTRRAEAAKDYLGRRGIDASRMETASLGETSPLDPGHTEEAWAQNRRDEFTILAGRETLASHLAQCR
ncbi:MAG TPA: OmpA family protein [Gemmatimonadales bacterium]